MNWLIEQLAEVCRERPVQEKILIVPSYQTGREVLEALARCCGGWVNLYAVTVPGLALETIGPYLIEKPQQYVNRSKVQRIIEDIFNALQEKNQLKYFKPGGHSWGLAEALAASVLEMRFCGLKSKSISANQFAVPDKGHDIILVLEQYENYLEKNKLFDVPAALEIAIDLLSDVKPRNERIFLFPGFIQLSPLEEQFLKKLAGDSLKIMKQEAGALKAQSDECSAAEQTNVEAWLPGDLEIDFFHAYGLSNEVREVIRRILAAQIPFDQVAVAYTSLDYAAAFCSLARTFDFDISLFEGFPAPMTVTGRLLLGLIKWVARDFSAYWIGSVLNEAGIEIVKDDVRVSGAEALRLLEQAEVGWGRERYVLLHKLADKLETRAEKMEDYGEDEEEQLSNAYDLKKEALQARCLYEKLQAMLDVLTFDGPDPVVGVDEAGNALLKALLLLCPVPPGDGIERAAREVLARVFSEGLGTTKVKLRNALERLENLVKECRVGSSNGRPGALQVVHYSNLIWTDRPCTFVVGLDASAFPGQGGQDPVLLDSERKKLHKGLKLNRDNPVRNRDIMELGLYSRRGRLTLSYSCFDLAEYRSSFPAFELLNIYRQARKDQRIDFSQMLEEFSTPAGFASPGREMDEKEWILAGILAGKKLEPRFAEEHYMWLAKGMMACASRQGGELGEYDGIVGEAGGLDVFDPRENSELKVSCTMIETLASCPFAYYLRYILGVKKPERIEAEMERWLSPLERGRLLHDLYCRFMQSVTKEGRKPDYNRDQAAMKKMAVKLLEQQKSVIPPANELVYKLEKDEILNCCEMFLRSSEALNEHTPVYFEVPFGFGQDEVEKAGFGKAEPVEIMLSGDKSIMLCGRIDRIDQLGDDWVVIDYKTGSPRKYKEHCYFNRGRQIQHALYACAVEQILQEKGIEKNTVINAGYFFPTEKGEGKLLLYGREKRDKVQGLLACLFDLIKKGTFHVVADKKDEACSYCEYSEVCRREEAVEKVSRLINDIPVLESWRRAKQYD